MIGSLLYGPVTWGRLLVVLIHISLTLVGVNAEERMLIKKGGQCYRQFMQQVPTQLIPDYRLIFFTEEQVAAIRNNILNVKP